MRSPKWQEKMLGTAASEKLQITNYKSQSANSSLEKKIA